MSLNIQILEAGTQVGIKFGNELEYFDRDKVDVYSTNGGHVGIRNLETDLTIVEAHPTEYLDPKEASVKDLVEKIKLIFSVVYVDYLTTDEIDAIQNANSPDASNPFVTENDIDGVVRIKGDWDANTNSPALASGVGTKGDTYRVSVAGTTNLDGISDWEINDRAYFDGTAWQKADNTDAVTSVHGRTGDVVAVAGDYLANQITFTPDGDIAATNVQDAIVEVRDDTDTKLSAKEDTANKGAANGYAPLDGTSKVPLANLPSDVTDLSTHSVTELNDVTDAGSGEIITDAERTKLAGIEAGAEVNDVDSVHGRTGAVVSAASDYDASQIDNDSNVPGTYVDDALNNIKDDLDTLKNSFYIEKITPGAPVTTGGALVEFFSSATGGVVPRSIDPAAGTYRVKISFIGANSSTFGRIVVDLQINGTSIFSVPYAHEPQDTNNRFWVTMERRVALSSGAQNVDINITQVGAGTAAMYEANVEIEEILT